jgi:YidC/Oxa1 family membrane protein insertase
VSWRPTGSRAPWRTADLKNFFILHEGAVGMADGTLEIDYSNMPDFEFEPREGARAEVVQVEQNGWIGFTDHYWMATLIPEPGTPSRPWSSTTSAATSIQTEAVLPTMTAFRRPDGRR